MSEQDAPERTFTQDDVDRIVQDRLHRDRQARVTNEVRVYAPESPHSYFADLANVQLDPLNVGPRAHQAHQRLDRYVAELAYEVEQGSREGEYVTRSLRTQTRTDNIDTHEKRFGEVMRELRAFQSGGGSTASAASSASVFVSPYFAVEAWAPYRGNARVFADQCLRLPLPPYGGQVYVPYFSTADSASQLSEGSGVSETDPTTALQNSTIVNVAGQITATNQVMERGVATTGGGNFDTVLYRQLCQQVEEKVDSYAIQSATSVGTGVSGSSSFGTGLGNFFQDLALAREGLTDTAGTRLRPTHLFTTSDLYNYITRQVASGGTPFFQPILAFPAFPPQQGWMVGADDGFNAGKIPSWRGFSGTMLPGNVAWFTDDNIPASGTGAQLIVTEPDEAVILFEDPSPVLRVFPQTEANNLEIIVSVQKYVAFLARHTAGIQIITGGAYSSSSK
jgi:hypothetical protein